MPGKKSGYRARLFRGLHAEGIKKGMDHDGVHDACCEHFGVRSMGQATDAQLAGLYRMWTGHTLKNRAKLPRRGEAAKRASAAQMISGEEAVTLDAEFAKRDLRGEERANFVRRQLRGRDQVQTRLDWVKVIGGLRAMSRRDGGRGPGARHERGAGDGGGGGVGGGGCRVTWRPRLAWRTLRETVHKSDYVIPDSAGRGRCKPIRDRQIVGGPFAAHGAECTGDQGGVEGTIGL